MYSNINNAPKEATRIEGGQRGMLILHDGSSLGPNLTCLQAEKGEWCSRGQWAVGRGPWAVGGESP